MDLNLLGDLSSTQEMLAEPDLHVTFSHIASFMNMFPFVVADPILLGNISLESIARKI